MCDNYGTHKHPNVTAWLAKHPRITLHFTPTSGSWLNMVEIFFGIITRQAIRRGTFTSVKTLIGAIETYIDGWNERCQPFTWTKTADQILDHCKPGPRTPHDISRRKCSFYVRRQYTGIPPATRPASPSLCGQRRLRCS